MASVSVGATAAQSSDGFANWTADVPLAARDVRLMVVNPEGRHFTTTATLGTGRRKLGRMTPPMAL